MKKTVLKTTMTLYALVMLFATSCSKADDSNPDPDENGKGFEHIDLSLLVTQWDDGWVSRIKDNWTEVAKGQLKIYIFHPNQQADAYHSDLQAGDDNAANSLVVPFFSNITSLQDRGMQSFESITFLTADATENETGKPVHLVFFKKHYSTGNGRYMLVVADSKAAFEREFGSNYINTSSWDYLEQSKSWDKLANMQWRNRFSLSPDLLTGKWSSGSSSTLSYYYINGGYAGATGAAVADVFVFSAGNRYESDHTGASGMIGNMQFSRQQYQGDYVLNGGWNIQLTNRFQGETEVFDGYFEAIKEGLLLVLIDKNNYATTLGKNK